MQTLIGLITTRAERSFGLELIPSNWNLWQDHWIKTGWKIIKIKNRIWTDPLWHGNALRKAIETLSRERNTSQTHIEYELDQPGAFDHGYVGRDGKFYRWEDDARWYPTTGLDSL